jgi:hypothetical protein
VNNRGAILVIVLALAGLAAASLAVWYQHRQTRRALDLWGAAAAQRIERAPVVELLELNNESREVGDTTGGMLPAETAIEISSAPGLLHFRRALLQDANFDWDSQATPVVSDSNWDYAVVFSDDEGSVLVLFDLDQGLVANRAATGKVAILTERMLKGINQFFSESLEANGAD